MVETVNANLSAKHGVVEEYHINDQHFARSIQVSAHGGFCAQIFTVDGEDVGGEQMWHSLLHSAREAVAGHSSL